MTRSFRAIFREQTAWVCFLATTLQVTFLQPYVVILGSRRVNLFSSLLAAMTFLLILIGIPGSLRRHSREMLLCAGLVVLALISSALSPVPAMSLARAFSILSAGLGGYWGGRLLLTTAHRQTVLVWLCAGLFGSLVGLGFLSYFWYGNISDLVDSHYHPMAGRLILLSFAPLTLLLGASRRWKAAAGALLAGAYLLLVLAARYGYKGTAVLLPAVMCLAAACLRRWPRRQFAGVLLALFVTALVASGALLSLSHFKNRSHDSVSYRVENLSFSWYLARQHPLFGIGLWSPRGAYLETYQIRYPYLTKADFAEWTRELRTSENNYLTFLVDLGFPFVLLYVGALLVIVGRLVRRTLAPPGGAIIPPLALLLPLVGELIHFLFLDGLFHPQVSWFFHLLLGLAAGAPLTAPLTSEVKQQFLSRGLVVLLVLGGGTLLGVWWANGGAAWRFPSPR